MKVTTERDDWNYGVQGPSLAQRCVKSMINYNTQTTETAIEVVTASKTWSRLKELIEEEASNGRPEIEVVLASPAEASNGFLNYKYVSPPVVLEEELSVEQVILALEAESIFVERLSEDKYLESLDENTRVFKRSTLRIVWDPARKESQICREVPQTLSLRQALSELADKHVEEEQEKSSMELEDHPVMQDIIHHLKMSAVKRGKYQVPLTLEVQEENSTAKENNIFYVESSSMITKIVQALRYQQLEVTLPIKYSDSPASVSLYKARKVSLTVSWE